METNKIVFKTKKEILSNYKKIKENKYGRTSTILRYDDNQLLKLFNDTKLVDKEKYKLLSEIELSNFAKPNILVYISNKFSGYIMDKKRGIMLEKIKNIYNLRDFLSNICIVEEDIYSFSVCNIIINDLHSQNILYDKDTNQISVIDMDAYFYSKYLSSEEIFYNNLRILYTFLLEYFTSVSCDYNPLKKIIIDELNKDNLDGEDIFNLILTDLENRYDTSIDSLKDFRNYSKKLIKK